MLRLGSKRWCHPCITLELHQVALLVREADLTLLVEAYILTVLSQPVRSQPAVPLVLVRLTWYCPLEAP